MIFSFFFLLSLAMLPRCSSSNSAVDGTIWLLVESRPVAALRRVPCWCWPVLRPDPNPYHPGSALRGGLGCTQPTQESRPRLRRSVSHPQTVSKPPGLRATFPFGGGVSGVPFYQTYPHGLQMGSLSSPSVCAGRFAKRRAHLCAPTLRWF